jgi:putative DNA methylase
VKHLGDKILGARTSGPHEVQQSLEEMRAGGPRTQGREANVVNHLGDKVLGARTSGPHEVQQSSETTPKSSAETAYPQAPTPPSQKGWYSRGYHPHIDLSGLVQNITFRLGDSVPDEVVQGWQNELGLLGAAVIDKENDDRRAKLREYIDKYEDAGHGACWLRDPRIAQLVEDALLRFDNQRYHLLEWCIMPNHVHVLLETIHGNPLSNVVRSWKTFTAREANRLLGRTGVFWMEDYFDRFVRDHRHYEVVQSYIWDNPVRAYLCRTKEEWRWSSAWHGWGERNEGGVVPPREMRAGGPRTQEGEADVVNHLGDKILGARTSGPHEVPPSLEEMRAGGPRTQEGEADVVNHLGDNILGARTSGPHQVPPSLKEMRAGARAPRGRLWIIGN